MTTLPLEKVRFHGLPNINGSSSGVNFSPTGANIKRNISSGFIDTLQASLPELNDNRDHVVFEYTHPKTSNRKRDNIYLTFVDEMCDNSNTLGFFTYPTTSVPIVDDISTFWILFPYVRKLEKGGPLNKGDTVMLPAMVKPSQGHMNGIPWSIGTTPADFRISEARSVGFFLIPNGWTGTAVDLTKPAYFSVPSMNPNEQAYVANISNQTVEPGSVTLGFEDLPQGSSTDRDYNDIIISIKIG